jgi:hypothetical protein
MTRAVLAVTVALLSACSSSVEGFARPAALVTTSPQTAAAPLAVEPGHLEPLALTATDIQTMVGTRPFAVVDPGHKGLSSAPADLARPECATWITVGLLTSYTGSGWIDAWVATMQSGPVAIGDPARRYVGQAITAYPFPDAATAALARIAAEMGKCAQDQFIDIETAPSWITDKVVFADPNLVTAYSFELDAGSWACAHHFAAKANVVVEMLNCANKDVVRGETRRLVNAILARVPGRE